MKTRPRRTVLSPGWWRHQQGMTLGIVLIFMSLAVPLVTGALGLAGRLSVDSRIKTAIATSQYSTMGANEHALYRLLYQSGYASSLALNVADNYVLTLNGKAINVSVLKLGEVPGQPSLPRPKTAAGSRPVKRSALPQPCQVL